MPDFTLHTFHRLLSTLKEQQYVFQSFASFMDDPAPKVVVLRHDVDARKMNSLQTAIMEKELEITGTYYFRMVPESFDEDIIKEIADLGHEIGYHYEDVSLTAERQKTKVKGQKRGIFRLFDLQDRKTERLQDKGRHEKELAEIAVRIFSENLQRLRKLAPVKTICMHGSPLSRWDNRLLWKYYDYGDFGITGEPYLDVNFEEVLYLTDTGRRWDGDSVNIRDKAKGKKGRSDEEQPATSNKQQATQPKFHSTYDIILAAKEGRLPSKIMITIHPQRWDNRALPWIRELVLQNVKNMAKRVLTYKERLSLFASSSSHK